MLQPKRTKFRKAFKGRIHGNAKGGTELNFGAYRPEGHGAGADHRAPDRGGPPRDHAPHQARRPLVDPHLPGRSGELEARRSPHGLGQGRPEFWVARVKPGRILFELDGVPGPLAKTAFERAAEKLPIKTKVVARLGETPGRGGQSKMAAIDDLKVKTDDQLQQQLIELKREQFNLRFQSATNQLEKPSRVREVRRTIARIKTLQNQRARAAGRPRRKERIEMPKRVLSGTVVSDKADKTVVVRVERRVKHPLYGKIIRLSKKYHAHDEANAFKTGEQVRIEECAPISKLKTWTVIDRIGAAKAAAVEIAEPDAQSPKPDVEPQARRRSRRRPRRPRAKAKTADARSTPNALRG